MYSKMNFRSVMFCTGLCFSRHQKWMCWKVTLNKKAGESTLKASDNFFLSLPDLLIHSISFVNLSTFIFLHVNNFHCCFCLDIFVLCQQADEPVFQFC